jgi:hypothetical protein
MFDHDAIHDRGRALEDEFFHRVDEQLRQKLRESMEREELREQLIASTGFKDKELVDHLLDAGFAPATVAALVLVPAVFVAWADGSVTPNERQAVMSAALQRGLENQPMAMKMVDGWLHHHPPRSLWKLWKEYSMALRSTMKPELAEKLKNEILRQCKVVAEASGGTLGFGKISKQEQEILDEIAED